MNNPVAPCNAIPDEVHTPVARLSLHLTHPQNLSFSAPAVPASGAITSTVSSPAASRPPPATVRNINTIAKLVELAEGRALSGVDSLGSTISPWANRTQQPAMPMARITN